MKQLLIAITIFVTLSCKKDDNKEPSFPEEEFISAVDISSYPEISGTNARFYDQNGNRKEFLAILKDNGINTIRLRLWVNPSNQHSGFDEVKQFSGTLKNAGFKIWLTLHYSDTWADPGQQHPPAAWQNLSDAVLKDSVNSYTRKVVTEIKPDYIQIGNEINSGFLHPHGNITTNKTQFVELLKTGIFAVRAASADAKIIIHFAGIEHAEWFFQQINSLDYDIIGLSYYPIWHGKSLNTLETTLTQLSKTHDKDVVIAETAYPFTLEWNDWTNNIVGLESQLILPQFPATAQGQYDFVNSIHDLVKAIPGGTGFCYWGAELIAWKGEQATNGSPWENQALFDFQNKALPVLNAFRER